MFNLINGNETKEVTKVFELPDHWGMQWHSWLRHCAASLKVTGSIPNGVIGIYL
jgi:hypothetical protein